MKKWMMPLFLSLETAAYLLILDSSGKWVCFGSVAVCFAYSLFAGCNGKFQAALGFTVAADWCLVVCDPIQRLWGMVAFLVVQSLYAAQLYQRRNWWLWIRLGAVATAEAVAALVLGKGMDLLAAVSMAYYAMLVMNLAQAVAQRRSRFAIALTLFLLCDTVVGLQVAGDLYISTEVRLLYPGFNLAWMFYLPAQVLLALESGNEGK